MCKIQNKRDLFDYFIGQIVEHEKERSKDPEIKADDVLQEYNMAKLMTLLYFTCLESVPENQKDFDYNSTLFGVFDNFITDLYGPVEVDLSIYGRFLPNYTFDKGQYFEHREKNEQGKNEASNDPLEGYKTMIHNFFKEAKEPINTLLSMDIDDLVALFQKLILWTYAIRTSSKRLAVRNSGNLKTERRAYNKIEVYNRKEAKAYSLCACC